VLRKLLTEWEDMKLVHRRQKNQSVALDANVLINLLNMNCIDILPKLNKYEFWMPGDVNSEVHRRNQRVRLRKALKLKWLKELEITDMAEMELYAKYRKRFGNGESACMAVGCNRKWIVASDEKAVKKEVVSAIGTANLLDTKTILKMAASEGVLDKSEFERLCENFEI